MTEFEKRARCITGCRDQHVFEPMMKKCLSEHPRERGTFEDMKKDLSAHPSKDGGKQAQTLQEQTVRHPHCTRYCWV